MVDGVYGVVVVDPGENGCEDATGGTTGSGRRRSPVGLAANQVGDVGQCLHLRLPPPSTALLWADTSRAQDLHTPVTARGLEHSYQTTQHVVHNICPKCALLHIIGKMESHVTSNNVRMNVCTCCKREYAPKELCYSGPHSLHIRAAMLITHVCISNLKCTGSVQRVNTLISPKWSVNMEAEPGGAACDGAHTSRISCVVQPVKSWCVTK